jgi:hypothetical protein
MNHFKACWVDVTDPREQAYADKRRQAHLDRMQTVLKVAAAEMTEEK